MSYIKKPSEVSGGFLFNKGEDMLNQERVVLKFGGKLVADIEKMRHIVGIVSGWMQKGIKPILVVSAMGKTTDNLIELSKQASVFPPRREMDALLATGEQVSASLLSVLFANAHISACSLNALQAGIYGAGKPLEGTIQEIDTLKINHLLQKEIVPIVTGFQAFDKKSEDFLTLGRGGSDMTAVKLAAAFSAPCILYKDVDGVCTTNPKELETAEVIENITYEDMKKIAGNGAQVVMKEAVEEAQKAGIEIRIANAASPDKIGTVICDKAPPAINIASRTDQALIVVSGEASILSQVPSICQELSIHMYSYHTQGRNMFTINERDALTAVQKLQALDGQVNVIGGLVEIGIVGGIEHERGFLGKVSTLLRLSQIQPVHISTGEGSISLAVSKEQHLRALRVLHDGLFLGNQKGVHRVARQSVIGNKTFKTNGGYADGNTGE